MKRMILAGAMCAVGAGTPALAQELNFRFETSEQSFTPMHSYVTGELGDQKLFFSGITGFGLHTISSPKGPEPIFAVASDYNQSVVIADESDLARFHWATGGSSLVMPSKNQRGSAALSAHG